MGTRKRGKGTSIILVKGLGKEPCFQGPLNSQRVGRVVFFFCWIFGGALFQRASIATVKACFWGSDWWHCIIKGIQIVPRRPDQTNWADNIENRPYFQIRNEELKRDPLKAELTIMTNSPVHCNSPPDEERTQDQPKGFHTVPHEESTRQWSLMGLKLWEMRK